MITSGLKKTRRVKGYSTLEKIWVIPVAVYCISLMLLLFIDGMVGLVAFLFDREWDLYITEVATNTWFWKLTIVMIFYSWVMFIVVSIKKTREK